MVIIHLYLQLIIVGLVLHSLFISLAKVLVDHLFQLGVNVMYHEDIYLVP
jgi:hypothetical protein